MRIAVIRKITCAIAVAAVIFCLTQSSEAATLPAGFAQTRVMQGLSSPIAFAFAPDGRLFVTEKGGSVRIIKNPMMEGGQPAQLVETPFYTTPVSTQSERGMIGIAIDPDFTSNHYVYVYHTLASSPIHNQITRLTAVGDVAESGSEKTILDLDNLNAPNHNGGGMHFGPDRKLYVGVGENANGANAQSLSTLLGKILRINADGTIPADNPYAGSGEKRGEIWAYGFRNPFTFAIDPESNHIYINDVGESTYEEVDDGVAGGNYGWPTCEGECSNGSFVNPIYQYDHSIGKAITGGVFYRASQFPTSYNGAYFFSDYSNSWIKTLTQDTHTVKTFATGVAGAVDLAVGPDGALYSLSVGTGEIFRYTNELAPTNTPTVAPTSSPTPTLTLAPTISITPDVTATPSATLTSTPTCSLKTHGDANCDDAVSLVDFEIWRKEYMGQVNTSTADFDRSGSVGLADYEAWRRQFMQ